MTRYTYDVIVTRSMTVTIEAPEGLVGERAARQEALRECRIHGEEDWQTTKVKEARD